MISEDYVSFEIAKLLKEKGFDENTPVNYFVGDDKSRGCVVGEMIYHQRAEEDTHLIACPTLQMAMKWLRKVHNIHIELNPICTGDSNEDLEWHYGWAVRTTIFTDRWKRHDAEHISYEQACEAAIKYCLENLI